jgi:hypothetical protein
VTTVSSLLPAERICSQLREVSASTPPVANTKSHAGECGAPATASDRVRERVPDAQHSFEPVLPALIG